MKRDEFLKSLFYTIGSSTLYLGCKSEGYNLIPIDLLSNEIDEIKNWFEKKHQFEQKNSRGINSKKIKRKILWDKAKKSKNEEVDTYYIPAVYEDNIKARILTFNEKNAYIKQLPEMFYEPLDEILIIKNTRKVKEDFIVQYSIDIMNPKMESSNIKNLQNLYGHIMRYDWDNNFIDGAKFLNGQIEESFETQKDKSSRRVCQSSMVYVEYRYPSPNLDLYEFAVSADFVEAVICNDEVPNPTYPSYQDGWNLLYGGSGGQQPYYVYYGGTSGSSSGINLENAAKYPNGTERQKLNKAVAEAVSAVGTVSTFNGFFVESVSHIMSRSLGVAAMKTTSLFWRGATVGGIGALADTYAVFVGIREGEFNWDEEGLSSLSAACGIIGIFASPPVAVALGGISVGIAIYQYYHAGPSI